MTFLLFALGNLLALPSFEFINKQLLSLPFDSVSENNDELAKQDIYVFFNCDYLISDSGRIITP